MKWFKHETDANMDAKLQEVLLDYGLEGYGLYWYCLELIAGNVKPENISFELEHDCRVIARNTGSTPQKVQEMMTAFINLGLFECSQNRIYCLQLANKSDDYTAKLVRKNPPQVIDNKEVLESPTNSEKVPLDKIKLDKKKSKSDTCPYQDIQSIYNELLPTLTSSRVLSPKAKKNIKEAWKSDEKHQNLDFWRMYFDSLNQLTTRMQNWSGEMNGNKSGNIELVTRPEIFARSINELIDQGIWK